MCDIGDFKSHVVSESVVVMMSCNKMIKEGKKSFCRMLVTSMLWWEMLRRGGSAIEITSHAEGMAAALKGEKVLKPVRWCNMCW